LICSRAERVRADAFSAALRKAEIAGRRPFTTASESLG
jgi:hypothetical protein